MTDTSWRAPDPTPVRRRKLMTRLIAVVAIVALVAIVAWVALPKILKSRDESSTEDMFNNAVDNVLNAQAVEVTGRAKVHSADSKVYFTAVRLEDDTMVGDIREGVTGHGLPVVDTGQDIYAQGDPSQWPLLGVKSNFSGWAKAPSADTVSLMSASVTKDNVAKVVGDPNTSREGLKATAPDGTVITVKDDNSGEISLMIPLEGDQVSENTIRPVDEDEADRSKEAVGNAVSGVGAQLIHAPGGAWEIEPFAGKAPERSGDEQPAAPVGEDKPEDPLAPAAPPAPAPEDAPAPEGE